MNDPDSLSDRLYEAEVIADPHAARMAGDQEVYGWTMTKT